MVTTSPDQPPTRPPQVSSSEPRTAAGGSPFGQGKMLAFGKLMLELIVAQVAMALADINILGVHPLEFLRQFGKDLQAKASQAYANSQTAQATATAANTKSDNIVDAIVSGLSGTTSTGNDPGAILYNFVNAGLQVPARIIATLQAALGQNATTQAQINALQNGGFTHDWAANNVTGWTNLIGVLALRGTVVQASSFTVAVHAGPTAAKYGASFVVDPTMRGSCRLAICSTSSGSGGIAIEPYRGFDGDALRLLLIATPTIAVVLKQVDLVDAERLTGATVLDIRTDGISKFTVLRNGQAVPGLDYTDTAGQVVHDSAHQSVVLTSNAADRNEDGYYGPAITGKAVAYAW